MKVVIMAGGFAVRLLPLTENRPKSLLPVAGKPIIDHIMEGIPHTIPQDRVIVSTNEKFRKAFEDWKSETGKNVELFVEKSRREEEKLGAIAAINYIIKEKKIKEDLFVIAGDNIFDFDLDTFLRFYEGNRNTLCGLYDMKDPEKIKGKYGVVSLEDNRITQFQEKCETPVSTLVSTGLYIYPRKIFPHFSKFLKTSEKGKDAPGYFNEWLCRKKVIYGFCFSGKWYDIGDRESYIQANMDYFGKAYVGRDCAIKSSTVERSVILGNSRIRNSCVKNCVIDSSELENVEIENCILVKVHKSEGVRN